MVRITLMDGSTQELAREGILGVFPCDHLFRHPQLKSDAVVYKHGHLLPVLGPLPPSGVRAWILLFETHGQVIRDLPAFDDDAILTLAQPSQVESDDDYLLKSA